MPTVVKVIFSFRFFNAEDDYNRSKTWVKIYNI